MGLQDKDSLKGLGPIIREILRVNHLLESHGVECRGITVAQSHLLVFINEKGQITMSELARAMGVTSGAATGLITRLVRRRLITRSYGKEDRRNVVVKLTPQAKALVNSVLAIRKKRLKRVLSVITPEEQKAFRRVLKKVLAVLTKEHVSVKDEEPQER